MDPDFIDMSGGFVWFDGYAVPITNYLDLDGDDCEPEEACVVVYGPLPGDGGWGVGDVSVEVLQ